ncbi:ras guanine nucleotide exchange factor domain-containing protein [Obelidium mucronatum]|nr:ras guanine nucleotide exchange factor domain-containing protein [Obelidium mucronatum]
MEASEPKQVKETHVAKYDYSATDETKLSLRKDDVIQVFQKAPSGWWFGAVEGKRGWFPSNFVKPLEDYVTTPTGGTGGTNESLNIRCETDDGQVYFVNRITGEMHWEAGLSPSTSSTLNLMAPMTPSGGAKAEDDASIGSASVHSNPSLNYYSASTKSSGQQLPSNWTKIDAPDGQTIYFNSITKEMQFTFPETASAEDQKRRLNMPSAILRSEKLPLNWSQKSLHDGRSYLFNFVTDQTTWAVEDIDESGNLLVSPPAIVDEINGHIDRLSQLEFPEQFKNWKLFSDKLVANLTLLSEVTKERQNLKILRQSTLVVETVRIFLLASRIAVASPEVRKRVRLEHGKVMISLAQTIRASSIACLVWPPPDALQCLQTASGQLVESMREFVVVGMEIGLVITDEDVFEANETSGKRSPEDRDRLPSNNEILYELKFRSSHIHEKIAEVVGLIQTNVFAESKSQILGNIRAVTTEVSDFLSTIDDYLPSHLQSQEISDELTVRKSHLFNAVAQLLSAISTATSPFAPSTAVSDVASSATGLTNTVSDIMVSIKFAIQEKELVEEGEGHVHDTRSVSSHDQISGESGSITDSLSLTSPTSMTIPKRYSSLQTSRLLKQKKPIDGDVSDDESHVSVEFRGLRLNIPKPASELSPLSPSSTKVEKAWYLSTDLSSSDIVLNADGIVKGGTLLALVERLTMHDASDASFVQSFLLTYRSFTTTLDLFVLLQDRFMMVPPQGLNAIEFEDWSKHKRDIVRLRVFNVMKSWLESYCYDDAEDHRVLKLMKHFAETVMKEESPQTAGQLSKLVDRREEHGPNMRIRTQYSVTDVPPPILPWAMTMNIKRMKFIDIDPLEIARQLTIMESSVYNKIQPIECLKKAWSEKTNNQSPNVKNMILLSNQIAGWVIKSILAEVDVKKRVLVLKHFISVADKCRSLNNFCTLNTILGALNSASIHRLKKTWAQVGKRSERFKELCHLMSLDKNFSRYRAAIHSANPPCIPYFGLCLTDLTFIEDGSADILKARDKAYIPDEFKISEEVPIDTGDEKVMINFFKHIKTAEVIRDIQQYQNEPYHLTSVKEIQEFLRTGFETGVVINDKELFALSLELEPRERDNERMARMLVNGGFMEKGDL